MRYFLALIACLLLESCSHSAKQTQNLEGDWQLISVFNEQDPSSDKWMEVNNGQVYTFEKNDSLSSTRFSCMGQYQISKDTLSMEFACPETYFALKYHYYFENNHLILEPKGVCNTKCAEKYRKIKWK